MTKRQLIANAIKAKQEKIKSIRDEIIELRKKDALLCDKEQWFTEKEETRGRGKNRETRLVGRINWKQGFEDEDTNETIWITRSQEVRINGEWI